MKFAASEKYRKYLICLRLGTFYGYVIWGTDMRDEETDKFFLKYEKILFLTKLHNIRNELKPNTTFTDEYNFQKWVESDEVFKIYSENDFSAMKDFSKYSLNDKKLGNNLINSINLIRDYSLQVQNDLLNKCLDSEAMQELFDYLYNEYFWEKKEGIENKIDNSNIQTIALELKNIWELFSKQLLVI